MTFTDTFVEHCINLLTKLDKHAIEGAATTLSNIRTNSGRVFVVGSGGGAGHASHATCDLRKLCNIEAYAPYDNVSELTARVNDDGWDSTLTGWLKVSRLSERDALLVFSVGGGNQAKQISMNLVNACSLAKERKAKIIAVVGRDGGYAGQVADVSIIIPDVNPQLVTPLTEGFQAVIWHLLVSHPLLQTHQAKWESVRTIATSSEIRAQ